MKLSGTPAPIFRIFDEAKAREFYVDWLGFTVDWEHRFEPGFPLYLQISRGDLVLHLSEHSGDATPGSTYWVPVPDVEALHAEITARPYAYLRPEIAEFEGSTKTLELLDPFGNRLRLWER